MAQTGCALLFVLVTVFSLLSLASDPMEESHGDAESSGCARGFLTSSNPFAWPWQRCCTSRTTGCTPSTALHGARTQPPGPGLRSARRTPRHGARSLLSPLARSTTTSTTTACGLTVSLTSGRRSGCCGTLWSRWLKLQVQQPGCSEVVSALGRWEPLPPHARVRPVLEQAPRIAETRLCWWRPGIAL